MEVVTVYIDDAFQGDWGKWSGGARTPGARDGRSPAFERRAPRFPVFLGFRSDIDGR